MAGWKTVFATVIAVNVEPRETVHALEFFETIQGNFAGASNELQELGTFFLIERTDCPPEPLDLRRSGGVVMVLCVILPVIHVDVRKTRDQKFQLLVIKNRN